MFEFSGAVAPENPNISGTWPARLSGLASLAARAVHGAEDGAHAGGGGVGVDADAPVDPAADLALDVGRGLGVGALGEGVVGVVQHPDIDADRSQRGAERRDRAVADALDLLGLAVDRDLGMEHVLTVDDRRRLVVEQPYWAVSQVGGGKRVPDRVRGDLAALLVGV